MPTRRAAVVATCVALAGVLSGCAAAPAPPPVAGPPTIGVVADQSSDGGAAVIRAATLAIDLVNSRYPDVPLPLAGGTGLPGLSGARLALAVGDTTGAPGQAEAALDRVLAQPGLAGVVAAGGSEVMATLGAYADRRQVPLVDAATSAGFLLEVGLDWYFRVTPSDRMLAEAVFALLAAEPAAGTTGGVTVLTTPDGGGADVVASLPELSRGSGLEVTTTIAVAPDAPFRLAATAPDPVVAVAATAEQAQRLSQVLAESGPPRPVVGMGGGFGPDQPAPGPRGAVYPAGWSAEFAQRHPVARTVADLYRARYEAPLTGAAAAAFTATLTLALAIDTARTADPAAVRAGLRQLSLPATQTIMPWNGVRFGPDGQNELAAAVVDQQTGKGPVLVYPRELAATDVSWPEPPATGPGVP